MVYAQYSFGVPLYANHIFGLLGPRYYGIIMTVNAVLVVVFTIFIISFTARIRPLINISLAGILLALGFGMLYFSGVLYLFLISTFLWTMGEILFTVNSSVFVANNSPISHRARFNSVVFFVSQSGFALTPLITGQLIVTLGIINIWPIVFILALTASIIMFGLYRFEKRSSFKQEVK
jgi:MFS family permease